MGNAASTAIWLLLLPLLLTLTHSLPRDVLLDRLGQHTNALALVHVTPTPLDVMKRIRVLCWVNTFHENHETRLKDIKRTWGSKCDKILFMSDIEDLAIPTVRITAPPTHEMLWQKHREVVKMLIREYSEQDFDWVFKCDDDTFVLMENLKQYLDSPEIRDWNMSKPLILGHRMTLQWWEMQRPLNPLEELDPEHAQAVNTVLQATEKQGGLYYTPGGGGYALNWAYLRQLNAILDDPHCLPGEVIPDDWAISFCMWFHDVVPRDTRDSKQRERFHQYNAIELYFKQPDEEAYDHAIFESIYEENNWYSDHFGIGWKTGADCCAPDTIAFHYVKPPFMTLYYEYYYGNNSDISQSQTAEPESN